MRIATWNVNSLKARMDRVEEWLAAKQPDVLLMQETKLSDEMAPEMPFRMAGYELLHHGEGRWNGVAIASRVGIADIVTNFGDGPVRHSPGPDAIAEALEAEASDASADEARMV
jgi:exodeoxyribonuclease-3